MTEQDNLIKGIAAQYMHVLCNVPMSLRRTAEANAYAALAESLDKNGIDKTREKAKSIIESAVEETL